MREQVMDIIKRPWVIPTAIGAAAFCAGAGVGFYYGRRYNMEIITVSTEPRVESDTKVEFEATVADLELVKSHEVKERTGLPDNRPRPDPRDLRVLEPEPELEPPVINIFQNSSDDNWDYEEEVAKRSPDNPYVLHKDEFWNEELGYSQTTLTYYEGDDILTDSEDVPIYGYDAVIGELKFGHGSGDSNVFHVRNDKLKAEYEVLRDPGRFSEIVLGIEADVEAMEDELKHSKHLKFRPDD